MLVAVLVALVAGCSYRGSTVGTGVQDDQYESQGHSDTSTYFATHNASMHLSQEYTMLHIFLKED